MRSTVLPGWGQIVSDRLLIGKTLVFVTGLLGIALLTVFLFVEPIEWAAWLADPDVLLLVVAGNVALAAMRLFAAGHAWVVNGGRRWFAALFLVTIVATPHAAVAWVGLETRDSLIKVFPGPTIPVAAAAGTTTTTTTAPTTTTTRLELVTVETAPGEYGDDEIDPGEFALWRPFGDERLNLLVLGGDAGPRRSGLRTDTIMVASVDPVSGRAALIGLPRNFGGVSLTDGTVVPVELLNAVYGWGQKHPELFAGPDPGAAATRNVVENITGLQIDYYMLVDLTGFGDLVDAFGGVQLEVAKPVEGPLYDPETGGYEMTRIETGSQHLDGDHALAYARARYGSSDYARMGRQRCILASMARHADPLQLLRSLPDLLSVIEANMSTDLPVELLPELIRLAPRVDPGSVSVIGFDSKWGAGRTQDGAVIPDVERIRAAVVSMIEDPGSAETFGAATAEAACG